MHTAHCRACGRPITAAESIARELGPDCAAGLERTIRRATGRRCRVLGYHDDGTIHATLGGKP